VPFDAAIVASLKQKAGVWGFEKETIAERDLHLFETDTEAYHQLMLT
jgi:hypothetical protein